MHLKTSSLHLTTDNKKKRKYFPSVAYSISVDLTSVLNGITFCSMHFKIIFSPISFFNKKKTKVLEKFVFVRHAFFSVYRSQLLRMND